MTFACTTCTLLAGVTCMWRVCCKSVRFPPKIFQIRFAGLRPAPRRRLRVSGFLSSARPLSLPPSRPPSGGCGRPSRGAFVCPNPFSGHRRLLHTHLACATLRIKNNTFWRQAACQVCQAISQAAKSRRNQVSCVEEKTSGRMRFLTHGPKGLPGGPAAWPLSDMKFAELCVH